MELRRERKDKGIKMCCIYLPTNAQCKHYVLQTCLKKRKKSRDDQEMSGRIQWERKRDKKLEGLHAYTNCAPPKMQSTSRNNK